MYQYLKNLEVDLNNLRIQLENIPEERWEYWVNPRGKIVKSYKQIYLKNTNINLQSLLDQIKIDHGPVVFLRYNPFSSLKPHTDWINRSAILIGVSDGSSIIFWEDNKKIVVPYTLPILANLENTHSVENDNLNFRFLLKIPFKLNYETTIKQIGHLI